MYHIGVCMCPHPFHPKARCIAAYLAHIERVKAEVPADKLLVFDVREGWAPLCAFLNVRTAGGNSLNFNGS